MDAGELQQAKDAYTDLTNYYIDNGLAENINFGVVQFSRNATPYFNLSANEAISTIQSLTTAPASEGTKYNDGLYQGFNFLSQSPLNALNTTNIAYFVADGKSQTNFFDPNDTSYVFDAQLLRNFANVQAFGIDDGNNAAGAVTQSQLNFVDSNEGLIVGDAMNLSTELLKSGLASDVESVNILVDGEVVDTITPEQLTDSPMGLTYSGSVDNLDVSIDAENIITAEVVFTPESNLATTTVDYTVTAGQGTVTDADGNPLDESGNTSGDEDPFARERNGSDSDDEITIGYADLGANGGAGNDYIVGNKRDNLLNGGEGDDTILGHEGDDTITTGAGSDRVDGGEGIDTVLYSDVVYQGNSNISLRQAANSVIYNNTDTLTDIEYLQFNDVRINAENFAVTPILEVEDISVREGNLSNHIAQLNFNLSTPAPVDVVFDYSTQDIDAVAGSDYVATSGQITIPAGETSASLNLEVIGDDEDEGIELFGLKILGLSGATFANNQTEYTALVTIENDDLEDISELDLATRINAGGDEYTDSLGQQWQASTGFMGDRTFSNNNPIAQTEDDVLYQSEHIGRNFNYTQAVPNGSYDVTLHFAEIFFDESGKRVFDVTLEDQLVLDDFDIYAQAGDKDIALERTFNVDVTDELINLNFLSSVDLAKVSAIEIEPANSVTRTNAGGDEYTDIFDRQWQASIGFTGGRTFSNINAIAQTEDDFLYQSEHIGEDFSYSQAVPNGSYDVTLHFAEIYFNQSGKRVFDVTLEDQLVLDDFDIYDQAGGKDIALEKTFNVNVNDGSLDLDLLSSVDLAKISAIEISASDF